MKYSKELLTRRLEDREPLKYLFFWGHAAATDEISKACLSQWYECTFVIDHIEYANAEQWMMVEKARLFGDSETLDKILMTSKPGKAKQLGREVRNFDQSTWEAKRGNIVIKGNRHKFGQNEKLKTFLLSTKDRVLVEASPVDAIWGIGMEQDHQYAYQPEKWRGLNLLGFALMEVRDELVAEELTNIK